MLAGKSWITCDIPADNETALVSGGNLGIAEADFGWVIISFGLKMLLKNEWSFCILTVYEIFKHCMVALWYSFKKW